MNIENTFKLMNDYLNKIKNSNHSESSSITKEERKVAKRLILLIERLVEREIYFVEEE